MYEFHDDALACDRCDVVLRGVPRPGLEGPGEQTVLTTFARAQGWRCRPPELTAGTMDYDGQWDCPACVGRPFDTAEVERIVTEEISRRGGSMADRGIRWDSTFVLFGPGSSGGLQVQDLTRTELLRATGQLLRLVGAVCTDDALLLFSWARFLSAAARLRAGIYGPNHPDRLLLGLASPSPLFSDGDWTTYVDVLHETLLARAREAPRGYENRDFSAAFERESRRYVNQHVIGALAHKYFVAGPYAFAVLEATLKRKCRGVVDISGNVLAPFTGTLPRRPPLGPRHYRSGQRVNRVGDLLGLWVAQLVAIGPDGADTVDAVNNARNALGAAGGPSLEEQVDAWRNILLHGQDSWSMRAPFIALLIALMIFDEIAAVDFEKVQREAHGTVASGLRRMRRGMTAGAEPRFPPDLALGEFYSPPAPGTTVLNFMARYGPPRAP